MSYLWHRVSGDLRACIGNPHLDRIFNAWITESEREIPFNLRIYIFSTKFSVSEFVSETNSNVRNCQQVTDEKKIFSSISGNKRIALLWGQVFKIVNYCMIIYNLEPIEISGTLRQSPILFTYLCSILAFVN